MKKILFILAITISSLLLFGSSTTNAAAPPDGYSGIGVRQVDSNGLMTNNCLLDGKYTVSLSDPDARDCERTEMDPDVWRCAYKTFCPEMACGDIITNPVRPCSCNPGSEQIYGPNSADNSGSWCCGWVTDDGGSCDVAPPVTCGNTTEYANANCDCRDDELPETSSGEYCCGWNLDGVCQEKVVAACGTNPGTYNAICDCPSGKTSVDIVNGEFCCGWPDEDNNCSATEPTNDGNDGGNDGTDGNGDGNDTNGGNNNTNNTNNNTGTGGRDPYNIFDGPNSETFRKLNPLAESGVSGELDSPGEIISRVLLFAFPLAGLILFAMIVWGGFEMITGATAKGIEAGRQRVTAAIVGFLLLFASYWIMQIVQFIFGVVIV